MPYDCAGRGINPEEGFKPWKVVVAVALCILVILFVSFVMNDAPRDDEMPVPGTLYTLELDCSDSAQMHEYGLPTKADVIQWHVHGSWGYYQDGKLYASYDLPGRDDAWDTLYEIKPNPAFEK